MAATGQNRQRDTKNTSEDRWPHRRRCISVRARGFAVRLPPAIAPRREERPGGPASTQQHESCRNAPRDPCHATFSDAPGDHALGRKNRNHQRAVGPTTPVMSFTSNTHTLETSAVGRNAAPRPTSVVVKPTAPATRAAAETSWVFIRPRKR